MNKTKKMDAKKLMVSLMAIVVVLSLVVNVSAAEIATNLEVKVNGNVAEDDMAVVAGEMLTVTVKCDALMDASNPTLKVEVEGDKESNYEVASFETPFENGTKDYAAEVELEVPYELKDEVSDDVTLTVTVKQGSDKTVETYTLRVQRPSYNAEVMSIVTPNTVEAGESFPVEVVLKNVGYNDLEDVYLTARLSALDGVERTVYFGDLVALEDPDEDDESETAHAVMTLQMPYSAEPGIYVLDVEASNEDFEVSASRQLVVENDFPKSVIKAGNELLIVNPTDKLVVYKVVTPENEQLVTVASGSSKTVQVNPTSEDYTVTVLDMSGELVDSFTFSAVEDTSVTSPVVVLTIILAIVFLVLLVVLIVLIGKKPEKVEEFGESYY